MKKTFFKSILCASLFVGAFTSCNEVEDLYNPELVREQAKKALGLDIAADQDWNMTSVVTANVTLNEDALSDYSFRIYSGNPINDAKAVVLADYPVKTDTQGKASASFKFEMPSYLNYVYVARVDNHGRRLIGLSKIQNGAISKAFGESSSVSTKAVTDYAFPTINFPYTEAEVETLLADAYDLTQGLSNSDGFNGMAEETGKTVAKIAGEGVVCNFANRFDDGGSNKLIIADGATWEIPDNGGILQIRDVDIIVANGGTLKFTGKLQLTGSTRLIVMEGGVVDNTTSVALSNGEYSIKVDGTGGGHTAIYNAGTIDANYIYADQGAALYNTETGVWKTKTTHCAGGNGWENFINWGKIESDAITSNGDQGTLYNACLIRASKLTVDQLSVNANSAIEVPIIDCNSIYMRENSIVRATTVAPSQKISVNYIGQEGGKALFSAETWELKGSPNNIDSNNVYIEMETFKINGQTAIDQPWDYVNQIYKQCFPNGKYPIGEAPLIISSEAASSIENADCVGQGNTPKDEVIEELLGSSNIYAFEDMSINGGDYDMNDVVLECTKLENNQISIKLIAAGATKKVYAFFRDTRSNAEPINLFGEVHEAFGQQSGVIINTGVDVNNLAPVERIIDVAEGFLFSQHGDIYIVDYQNREAHISKFTNGFQPGDAPYGILVPITWKYPKEWVKITTAYPEFAAWAGGDDTASGWYTHPSSSNVY